MKVYQYCLVVRSFKMVLLMVIMILFLIPKHELLFRYCFFFFTINGLYSIDTYSLALRKVHTFHKLVITFYTINRLELYLLTLKSTRTREYCLVVMFINWNRTIFLLCSMCPSFFVIQSVFSSNKNYCHTFSQTE